MEKELFDSWEDKRKRQKLVNLLRNPIYIGKSRGVEINKRVVFPTLISV